MADSYRPNIKRAKSNSTFYEVRGAEGGNSDPNALGVIYPLFFLGALIVALFIFVIRGKESVVGPVTVQDPESAIHLVPNITQRVEQQTEGTYNPYGSAMTTAPLYSGAI